MDLDSLLKSIREENKGGAIVPAKFFGEDRHSKYLDEFLKDTTIGGEYLTNEEKKEGYKKRNNKIDFEAFVNKVLKTRDEIKEQGQEQDTSDSSSSSLPESKGSAIVKRDSVNIEKFKHSLKDYQVLLGIRKNDRNKVIKLLIKYGFRKQNILITSI